MSTLDPGHPVGYMFRRETKNIIPGWRPMVDRSLQKSKNLFRKNLYAHFGCVNAVEFSRDGNLLTSGGDDRRILLWNVDKAIHTKEEPTVMQAEHGSNVFALTLDSSNRKIFSAGNDDQVIIHDVETCVPLDYFIHEQPVYGISIDPLNDCVFASAGDDGRILIYDTREPSTSDPFCLANLASAFHAVMFHPTEPRLVVSGNSKEGVALWDIRKPKIPLLRYGGLNADQCCMSARFNSDGSKILALRRRLPPVLYATKDTAHLYQFNHTGYYNSCTMKSCSFAGTDDQFVLSGSDNFDLYMWRIPPEGSDRWVDEAHLILRGHRSIVNQVRYNKVHSIIASSGVEKLIKVWSPFAFNSSRHYGKYPSDNVYEKERRIYSHTEYINLVTQSGQFMSLTYDTTRRSTREDPRMMAFFDALVQRDIEGWSDDSDNIAENSYAAISEMETTPSEDSTNSEDEPQLLSRPSPANGVEQNEVEEVIANVDVGPNEIPTEGHDELPFDNSESEDLPPFEDGALIMSQSTLDSQEFPTASTQEPNNGSADEDDEFKRNFYPDSDASQPIVNDGNIIKELISRKHERLRQLAKAHVILESTLKKPSRKRKSMYSSTSTSESSSSDDDTQPNKRIVVAERESSINAAASTSTSASSHPEHASESRCKIHSQVASGDPCARKKKMKGCARCNVSSKTKVLSKKLLKNFKRLRYEKKSDNGSSHSGNFCSYYCKVSGRYQHPCSDSSSTDTDDEKPVSKFVASQSKYEGSETISTSTSSSSSTSSASESTSESEDSSVRKKPRPCSSPNLIVKPSLADSSECEDEETVRSESNDNRVGDPNTETSASLSSRLRNSQAFRLSPLIRRIEIERLKKLQRLEKRRAAGNHFSTRNQSCTPMLTNRTWTSSSSGASSDDEGLDNSRSKKILRKYVSASNGNHEVQQVSCSQATVSFPEEPLDISSSIDCHNPELKLQNDNDIETSLQTTSSLLSESSHASPTSDYESELHTFSQTSPGLSTSCGQRMSEDD